LRVVKAGVVGAATLAFLSVLLAGCGGPAPTVRLSSQSTSPCATTGQTVANVYTEGGSATLVDAYSSTASDVASWQVSRVANQGGDLSNAITSLAGDTPVAVCYYTGAYGGFPEPPQVPRATRFPQPYYHFLILDVVGSTVIIDSVGPTQPAFGPPTVVIAIPTPSSSARSAPTSPSSTPSP
jgi:hypothetical protein